jgi:hypothetical protein
MDAATYARLSQALTVAEHGLQAPNAQQPLSSWKAFDGHARIVASLYRSLGHEHRALSVMRWFRDLATVAARGVPGLSLLADRASTTVWEWESHSHDRYVRNMELRRELLDATLHNRNELAKALHHQIADSAEQDGNYAIAVDHLRMARDVIVPDDAFAASENEYLTERIARLSPLIAMRSQLDQPAEHRHIVVLAPAPVRTLQR